MANMVFILVFLIGLLLFIYWLRTLIDCIINEPSEGSEKIIWVLVIIFLNLIGAIVYTIVRLPKRIEQYGR